MMLVLPAPFRVSVSVDTGSRSARMMFNPARNTTDLKRLSLLASFRRRNIGCFHESVVVEFYDPMLTASKLLENFGTVLTIVKATHPSVARSIALAACRTTDPEGTARQYVKNYDNVLRLVRRTDPDLAHVVALQTCRSMIRHAGPSGSCGNNGPGLHPDNMRRHDFRRTVRRPLWLAPANRQIVASTPSFREPGDAGGTNSVRRGTYI
jgi:hypothetical protein